MTFGTQGMALVMNRWLSTASAIGRFLKSGFSIAYAKNKNLLEHNGNNFEFYKWTFSIISVKMTWQQIIEILSPLKD